MKNCSNSRRLVSTIAGLEKLKPEEIVLYAGGNIVSDADVVSVFEETDIEITAGLLGGKVHGSLARAGKFIFETKMQ
ncbi:hypothetical protein WA026_007515 [Henosepilachna vigintioctopunctata]|uniref:40S ribosomal protein S30 n=1 Tax=Henosepilachna vigintioctopunctata TaxID=420089 RepID=A0AAW1UXE7_9CUCU